MNARMLKPFPVLLSLAFSMTGLAQESKAAPKPEAKATVTKAPKKPEAKAPNYLVGETAPATKPGSAPAAKAPKSKKGGVRKKAPKLPYEKRINLNAATKEELKTLPGMTDEFAAKIIAGRPYKSKAGLVADQRIPGWLYFTIKDKVAAGKLPAKP